MSAPVTYTPQLIVDVENTALLYKLKEAIKLMQGVGNVVVVQRPMKAATTEAAPSDVSSLYEISPTLKALEGDFVCPSELSFDYKKEAAKARSEKYL